MDNREIKTVLQKIGERVPAGSRLILVGGSALALLGNMRPTIDIDFIGDDIRPSKLHQSVLKMAEEFGIYADAVPLERFIPLPKGSEKRDIHIGQFGNLDVYVADPYSIASAKWIAVQTLIMTICFFSSKTGMWKSENLKPSFKQHCHTPVNSILSLIYWRIGKN
jgi:hypothetical protein